MLDINYSLRWSGTKLSTDKNIFRKKTGLLRKILCCNCLSEDRIIRPIKAVWICLGCGAINDPKITLWISYIPDPTGREL